MFFNCIADYWCLFLSELSKAQRSFANVLSEFRLECIGEIDTDDEIEIGELFNLSRIVQLNFI